MAQFELKTFLASIGKARNPQLTFRRFQLPDSSDISCRNAQFHSEVVDRFKATGQQLPTYTVHELSSKLGEIEKIADPVGALRRFNEEHTLRIAELFKANRDALQVAEQLANVREVLATWAFRLAASEHQADLALAIGGSGANGVLTFKTDYDFVVLPHAEADKEPARKVQFLMSKLLISIGLEADWVMFRNFEGSTLKELGDKFEIYTKPDLDPLQRIMRSSNVSFFRFLSDIRIVNVYGGKTGYQEGLSELKERLVFGPMENMLAICRESFEASQRREKKPDQDWIYDIKNNPLRLLHYALYASRAKLGIHDSDFTYVIGQLEEKGILSAEKKEETLSLLSYFIGLRHLLALTNAEAKDATKIREKDLERLAEVLGIEKAELSAQIENARQQLVELSRTIIERIS